MKTLIVLVALIVLVSGGPSRGYRRQQSSRGGGNPLGGLLAAKAFALKTALGVSALGTAATVGGIYAASALGLAGIGTISAISLGKRSVDSTDELALAIHYFDLAMELDSEMCVPLIFCETAVKGQSPKATKFETDVAKMAANAFRRVGSGFVPRTLGELVIYGTMLGSQSKSLDTCSHEFPTCQHNSTDYIEEIYNTV